MRHPSPGTALDPLIPVRGYASIFNRADLSGDIIRPGSFRASILRHYKRDDPFRVAFLYQHHIDQPIGNWKRLVEDDRGLWVEGEIAARSRAGADASALIEAEAINGLSIGFQPRRMSAATPGGHRILHRINLWEISLVTFPLSPDARLSPGETNPFN